MPPNSSIRPERYIAPPPTALMTQAAGLLLAGIAITSTSAPALNATYPCDPATRNSLSATLQYTQANNAFPLGITTLVRPDASGTPHEFATVALFQAFATAVGAYTAALVAIAGGTVADLPSPSAVIL